MNLSAFPHLRGILVLPATMFRVAATERYRGAHDARVKLVSPMFRVPMPG